ncbi:MAG: metal-dependent hydrolase [Ideonella sp.]|nr:metal-dependent hydrolase [Ideonella sp.]MCC7458558.1 metal-dependent hydrolase [Nitrospira sp.]
MNAPAAAAHTTAEPVVRRLLVDLDTPLPRHWCGGDAFRTAWFDALSMSFPFGEQFFIDAVRAGVATLEPAPRAAFEPAIKAFVGQEATHRRIHARYNEHLARRGLVNRWEARSRRRLKKLDGVDLRIWVGATAATEHFTAILAEYLLSSPSALAGAEPRLATLWRWHASEETEHRSTAFDLYRAMGGNERWRLRLFRVVTRQFVLDALRQTLNNLWRDGSFWRRATWVEGWRFLFGRSGLVRSLSQPWRRYLRADFHPSQQDGRLAAAWLLEHAAVWEAVGNAEARA